MNDGRPRGQCPCPRPPLRSDLDGFLRFEFDGHWYACAALAISRKTRDLFAPFLRDRLRLDRAHLPWTYLSLSILRVASSWLARTVLHHHVGERLSSTWPRESFCCTESPETTVEMMVREPFLEGIILPPCASQQLPCTGLLPRFGARLLTATVLLLLSCGSCLISAHAAADTAPAASCSRGSSSNFRAPAARWLFWPPAAGTSGTTARRRCSPSAIFACFAVGGPRDRGSSVPQIFLLHESIDLDELYTVVPLTQIVRRRLIFGVAFSEVARLSAVHQYQYRSERHTLRGP